MARMNWRATRAGKPRAQALAEMLATITPASSQLTSRTSRGARRQSLAAVWVHLWGLAVVREDRIFSAARIEIGRARGTSGSGPSYQVTMVLLSSAARR